MSQNVNEFSNFPIGNVLQVIIFLYCRWIFCALSIISYAPRVALSDGTSESDIRVLTEKICGYKVLIQYFIVNKSVQLEPKLGKILQTSPHRATYDLQISKRSVVFNPDANLLAENGGYFKKLDNTIFNQTL